MQYTITSDAEFLQIADDLAGLTSAETKTKAEMEAALQAVRDQYAPTLQAMRDTAGEKAKALKNYLTKKGVAERLFNPGENRGESSRAYFGWRTAPPSLAPLNTKEKEADIIARLYDAGYIEWLTIAEPKLNKAAILAAHLAPEDLAKIGLRIKNTTRFFCEIKDRAVTKPITESIQ